MTQQNTSIGTKSTGGTLSAAEFNQLNSVLNSNSTDAENRLVEKDAEVASLESKVYPYTTDFTSGIARTQNLTTISGFANTSVDSIYIGSNATSIGDSAFYQCFSLASLNIPDSVTSIGDSAFNFCVALTSINIPDSVTSIGDSAFNFCHALTSINIPDSITSIGANAFERCYSLTSMTFPEGLTSIPDSCNADCGLIPSVSIPNSVTSIGEYAFAFCYSLNTVNCLATAAPTLGSGAFDYISATEIHVPVGATGYGTTYGGLTVVYDL